MRPPRQTIEHSYQKRGLATEHGFDRPGKTYEPHRHEKTYLYTLKGSLRIRLDGGEWQTLKPGQECIVGSGQLHEAVAGPEGWEYVAAWDENEAEQFESS